MKISNYKRKFNNFFRCLTQNQIIDPNYQIIIVMNASDCTLNYTKLKIKKDKLKNNQELKMKK